MTLQECTGALTVLAFELGQALDAKTYRAYYRSLGSLPAGIFAEACRQEARRPRAPYDPRFPPPAALRQASERARRQLLAAYPHEACAECEHAKGWRPVTEGGVTRMERCPCVGRHQAKLAGLGLVEPVADLPGESAAEGGEQVYPTLAQLPTGLQARLRPIVDRKRL